MSNGVTGACSSYSVSHDSRHPSPPPSPCASLYKQPSESEKCATIITTQTNMFYDKQPWCLAPQFICSLPQAGASIDL